MRRKALCICDCMSFKLLIEKEINVIIPKYKQPCCIIFDNIEYVNWRGGTYPDGEPRPVFRGYVHFVSLVLFPIGFGIYQYQCTSTIYTKCCYISILLALILMFGISSHFHRLDIHPNYHRILKRLDHSTIFFFIGSSYNPFALLLVQRSHIYYLGYLFVVVNCSMIMIGAIHSISKTLTSKQSDTSVFFVLGQAFCIVPFLYHISLVVSYFTLICLSLTWLIQATGVTIYKKQLCNRFADTFGYHEWFHVCTVIGTLTAFGYIIPTMVLLN